MKKIYNFLFLILPLFSIGQIVGNVCNIPQANNISLDLNQWQYIAITKGSNNQATVYKNGALVYSGSWSNISYTWSRLTLGCVYYTNDNSFFQGQIDEVRLSNTVRTASEISTYYNSNSTFTSDSNTIGLWHLDNITGSTVSSAVGTSGVGSNINVTTGKFGNCYTFNGTNSKVDINQAVPTSNMTCEFWIKPTAVLTSWAVSFYGFNTSGFGVSLQSTTSNCNIPQGNLASGLVAYYPFCGNANDESGNSHNGVVNGAVLTPDRFGNANSAYNFTGSTNDITLANSQSLINSSFSVSAWCTIDNLSPSYYDAVIIGQYNGQVSTERKWLFGYRSISSQRGISYYLCDNLGNFQANSYATNWVPIQTNWYHIVWVFDSGNSIKTYVNGVLNSDVAMSLTNINNVSNNILTKIGNGVDTDVVQNLPWNGKVDDVGIWNRTLTPQEITNLYNNNLAANSFEKKESLITIYPNPTNSKISLDFGTQTELIGSEVRISNILGQEIYNSTINQQIQEISLSTIASNGLYFISIVDSQGKVITTKKVVLQ
jgi:hypothetical protein